MQLLKKPTQFKYGDVRADGYLFSGYELKLKNHRWYEQWLSPEAWERRRTNKVHHNKKYLAKPEVKKHKTAYHTKYKSQRRATDSNFKIAMNLRSRVCHAIKNKQKAGSAIRDLGCTIDELIIHLQSKFTQEMSWENYGSVWEIDHIKPLSKFDLTDREQFKEAAHYTNLQPLTCEENRRKFNS